MADSLDDSYTHLEQKVVERTTELEQILQELQITQAQLIQTEKMSSLGQLVAGIAHEINNPLSFISGNINYAEVYTQNLLKLVEIFHQSYPQPELQVQKYLQEIDFDFLVEDLPKLLTSMKMGSDRITQLILNLRNFSRLDEAEMKSVKLHEGIESTLVILQHRLKASSDRPVIEVIKEYENLPLLECYPGQLNQVFMNILSNAIDALSSKSTSDLTKAGNKKNLTPKIWIRTKMANHETVSVEISDNGIGIPEKAKANIFNPFFTTKPVGQGTGLGLSISYKIVVEKHHGLIWCESQLGEGTTFYIQIPVKQSS